MVAKKKLMMFGGCGLIGSQLVVDLQRVYDIIVVDNKYSSSLGSRFINVNIFDKVKFTDIILKHQPDIIINTVNIATLASQGTDFDEQTIIQFFLTLKEVIRKLHKQITYAQIGTTGSGGLGFDIPFTHGEGIENMPIIKKSAAAGITTMMLVLLSRTFGDRCRIIEIKPGLSIFNENILTEKYKSMNIVTVDGGESGSYSYDELGLLTSFMGFSTVQNITKYIINELLGLTPKSVTSGNNVIAAINKSIITENAADRKVKLRIMKDMKKKNKDCYLIATGNLGPPSVTKTLIESYISINTPKMKKYQNKMTFTNLMRVDALLGSNMEYMKKKNTLLFEYLINEVKISHNSQHGYRESYSLAAKKLAHRT